MPEKKGVPQQISLAAAGLAGKKFPESLLTAVSGGKEWILELLDSGILESAEQAGWLRCREPERVQRAMMALEGPVKRKLSLKLGKAAEELRLPEELSAGFYAQARETDKARQLWVRAAERACDRREYSSALDFLVRALEVWPWNNSPSDRVRILREQARCAANAGKKDVARSAWEELADFASESRNDALQVEAYSQLAGLAHDTAKVTAYLKNAADLAETNLSPSESIRVMLDYVDNLASRVRVGLAKSVMVRVVDLAESAGSMNLLSEVRGWQGLIAAMAGEHEFADLMVEESLRIAIDNELPEQAALAYRRRANIAEYCGNYGKEVAAHTEAIQYCRKVEVEGQVSCLSCLSYACFRTGNWKEALESARAVIEDPDAHPVLKGLAECVEGLVASFRGERKVAERKLNSALACLRLDGLLGLEFFALMGLAFQESMCGETGKATRIYDEVRALWRESEDLHDVVPALLLAGGHYASQGLASRLADCIDILVTICRKNPLEETKAVLIALQGNQAFLSGDRKGFLSSMEEAGTIFARIGLPLERIWVTSSAALVSGEPGMDGECTAIARRLGLRPFLALFEKAAPDIKESACDLTPRQKEVLLMLAEGLTSKEMAARLFLSTRTVEMHVGRLLERMNCRTRPEAVKIASERGWL